MTETTDTDDTRALLERELPGLRREVVLAQHCAYTVGGPAELLYEATSTQALRHAVTVARELAVPLTVLGQATNVLVSDAGVRGLVVLARNAHVRLDGELLTAGAGAVCAPVIAGLAEQGLAGLEFAGNIPGSFGGAVVGNAGAYGACVADALVSCELLIGGEQRTTRPDDLGFEYRSSALKRGLDAVVLEATFALHGAERSRLLGEIARDAERRRRKHPLEWGSCGSYFKNPSRDLPAARLIEQAGLKGLTVGRAQVSEKHANFLVALPGATAADIRVLADEVKRRVLEESGVRLVEEVRLLGCD